MIYFDHNAAAPLMPEARRAWLTACDLYVANPSSPHRMGARADAALDQARERLARLLGSDPLDLVWTSGATESNNLVLHHYARTLAPAVEVWFSAIEHPSVLESAPKLFPGRLRRIPVTAGGIVDVDWIRGQLTQTRPGLVGVMAANNETGVLQPWREVLALCQEREVAFFTDAVQWLGRLPAQGLGQCDFVSGCAHKVGGPRGIGFLKCPSRSQVHALLTGGHQEDGRRAGTQNVAGALALVAALEAREQELARGEDRSRYKWRETFAERLQKELPDSTVLGIGQERLWNTVAALMPAVGNQQRWVVKLDKSGFAVSTGSACSTGNEQPSHVLLAMGLKPEEASRVLRFSSGWDTRPEDWQALLAAVTSVDAELRRTSSPPGSEEARQCSRPPDVSPLDG